MYDKGMYCPGCEVSWTAFPSKCCRNVATRAASSYSVLLQPIYFKGGERGQLRGKGKYVHSSPANPSKRKFLQSYIIVLVYKIDLITFSACNLIFSQQSTSDSSLRILINQLEFFTLEFLISEEDKKIRKLLSL